MTTTAGDPPSRSVLVVEDDRIINDALAERFRACGYAVHQAWDGPGAVDTFAVTDPDVVLLDLMLPGFDGLEVCRRIQAHHPVPVLMITARDEEADIVLGLGVGADDYITKPFRMREVTARVEALLRRVDRANELAVATPPTAGPVARRRATAAPRRACARDARRAGGRASPRACRRRRDGRPRARSAGRPTTVASGGRPLRAPRALPPRP